MCVCVSYVWTCELRFVPKLEYRRCYHDIMALTKRHFNWHLCWALAVGVVIASQRYYRIHNHYHFIAKQLAASGSSGRNRSSRLSGTGSHYENSPMKCWIISAGTVTDIYSDFPIDVSIIETSEAQKQLGAGNLAAFAYSVFRRQTIQFKIRSLPYALCTMHAMLLKCKCSAKSVRAQRTGVVLLIRIRAFCAFCVGVCTFSSDFSHTDGVRVSAPVMQNASYANSMLLKHTLALSSCCRG